MIKCSSCGAENSDSATFCSNCGKKLEHPKNYYCPHCGGPVRREENYCSHCGYDLYWIEDDKIGHVPMLNPKNPMNARYYSQSRTTTTTSSILSQNDWKERIFNDIASALVIVCVILCIVGLTTGYSKNTTVGTTSQYGIPTRSSHSDTTMTMEYFFKDGWDMLDVFQQLGDSGTREATTTLFVLQFISFLIALIGTILFGAFATVNAAQYFTSRKTHSPIALRLLLGCEFQFVMTMIMTNYSSTRDSGSSAETGLLASGTVCLVIAIVIGLIEEGLWSISHGFLSGKRRTSSVLSTIGAVILVIAGLVGFTSAVSVSSNGTHITASSGESFLQIIASRYDAVVRISSDESVQRQLDSYFNTAEIGTIFGFFGVLSIAASFVFGNDSNTSRGWNIGTAIFGFICNLVASICAVNSTKKMLSADSSSGISISLGRGAIAFIILIVLYVGVEIATCVYYSRESDNIYNTKHN